MRDAIKAQAALIKSAQEILTNYLVPDGITASAALDQLLGLLDGRRERDVSALVNAALAPDKTMPLFVAYTNTDCTEGRGHDVPVAVCKTFATATRYAVRSYVQGADGPVKQVDAHFIYGHWFVPLYACVDVKAPSAEDVERQKRIDATALAVAKAKESGLTDDDIKALKGAL